MRNNLSQCLRLEGVILNQRLVHHMSLQSIGGTRPEKVNMPLDADQVTLVECIRPMNEMLRQPWRCSSC
jgi:hypothetical protein